MQAHQSDLQLLKADFSLAIDLRGQWSDTNMAQTGMLAGIADGEGFAPQALLVMTARVNAVDVGYRSCCESQLDAQPGYLVTPLRSQLGSLPDFY